MSILFDTTDPRGFSIHCEKKQWHRKIIAHHSELEGHQDLVKQTIEDPLMICSDATNPNREIYYNLGILPAPLDQFYLKIVVQFSKRAEKRYGAVITAFVVDKGKTGEKVLWTSPRLSKYLP